LFVAVVAETLATKYLPAIVLVSVNAELAAAATDVQPEGADWLAFTAVGHEYQA
jgi:hypothetical protein